MEFSGVVRVKEDHRCGLPVSVSGVDGDRTVTPGQSFTVLRNAVSFAASKPPAAVAAAASMLRES